MILEDLTLSRLQKSDLALELEMALATDSAMVSVLLPEDYSLKAVLSLSADLSQSASAMADLLAKFVQVESVL